MFLDDAPAACAVCVKLNEPRLAGHAPADGANSEPERTQIRSSRGGLQLEDSAIIRVDFIRPDKGLRNGHIGVAIIDILDAASQIPRSIRRKAADDIYWRTVESLEQERILAVQLGVVHCGRVHGNVESREGVLLLATRVRRHHRCISQGGRGWGAGNGAGVGIQTEPCGQWPRLETPGDRGLSAAGGKRKGVGRSNDSIGRSAGSKQQLGNDGEGEGLASLSRGSR